MSRTVPHAITIEYIEPTSVGLEDVGFYLKESRIIERLKEGGCACAPPASRAGEVAFDDPGVGGLLAVEGFRLAVNDGAPFLDHDLRGKRLGAVFASPSNKRVSRAAK